MTVWMFVGTAAVSALTVWLVVGLWKLHRLLRDAERDQRAADRLVLRYGGSLSWNDETPVRLDSNRGTSATHSRKG